MKHVKEMSRNRFILLSAITVGGITFFGGIIYFLTLFSLEVTGEVPPSSTSSLIILWGIFWSLGIGASVGAVGAGIGWIISFLFGRSNTKRLKERNSYLFLIILFIITLLIACPIENSLIKVSKEQKKIYDEENRFGVKKDSEFVTRIPYNETIILSYDFELNKQHYVDLYKKQENLSFNGEPYYIHFNCCRILVGDTTGNYFINYTKNAKYPYISTLSYISYISSSGSSYLLVLADLRPTSRRSLFLIFNEKGENIYEELLYDFNIIEIAKTENDGDVVIMGQEAIKQPGKVFLQDYVYKLR